MSCYYSTLKLEADGCREMAVIEMSMGDYIGAEADLKCAKALEEILLNITLSKAMSEEPDWL